MARLAPCAFLLLSLALSGSGCAAGTTAARGYPLYTVGAATSLPSNQVAQLSTSMPGGAAPGGGSASFIKTVDGRDVATLDTAFELLPGCHIVETDSNFLVSNQAVTWRGNIGTRVFPLRMRAGCMYTIVVELAESFGRGRVSVYGVEKDPSGALTQVISAAKSPDEVRGCRAWKAPGS